jgi:hypothetical protein
MADQDLRRKTKDNLLFIIKASVGSDIFRHIYVKHSGGREFDATDDGDKSCAYHTSGVLSLVGLIDKPHATVETALKHMQQAGWYEAKKPIAGAVVVWPGGKNQLSHSGFYLDDSSYVSNSSNQKQPVVHGKSLKDGRLPTKYYVHPELLKH